METETGKRRLSMEAEIRQRRINMSTLGMGVIAFGVWSILKFYLYIWVDSAYVKLPDVSPEVMAMVKTFTYVFIAVFLLIDLGLRLYLGLSARAEGMGKRKGRTYIVLTALLLIGNVIAWVIALFNASLTKAENQSTLDFYVSLLVDFSSTAMLADLLYNAIRLRKLEKAKAKEG